jgi:hypothetical protein
MQRWLQAPHIVSALRTVSLSLALGILLYVSLAFADTKPRERARYAAPDEQGSTLRFTPMDLSNGSKLTLISPSRWSDLAEDLAQSLHDAHDEYTALFSDIPAFKSSIRLMDEQAFYELTGAPSWTNAMFFRGEIIIPLSETQPVDLENLQRSVKHEFTHAVLSSMSGGQIPGWLDEGVAQWAEGYEHPALREALRKWLQKNEPVPLNLLQGGFTKLDPAMVPSAYAESLLASKAMIQAFGFRKIGAYLALLRKGVEKPLAFEVTFGLSLEEFEEKLGDSLKTWAKLPVTKSALQ